MREFLYVDDMAEASLFVHKLPRSIFEESTQPMLSHINIGTPDVTIRELAEIIKNVVGFSGELGFDASKPAEHLESLWMLVYFQILVGELTCRLSQGWKVAMQIFFQTGGGSRL